MSDNAIFQSHEQKTWNEFYSFVDTQLQSLRESKPDDDYQNLLKKLSAAGLTVAENKIIRHTEQKLDTSTEQNQPSFLETCDKFLSTDGQNNNISPDTLYAQTKIKKLRDELKQYNLLSMTVTKLDLNPLATKPFTLRDYYLAEAYMLVEFFKRKNQNNTEYFDVLLNIYHYRQLALAALKSTDNFPREEYNRYLTEEYNRFVLYVNHHFLQNELSSSHVALVTLAPLSAPKMDHKHNQLSSGDHKTNIGTNTLNTAIACDEPQTLINSDTLTLNEAIKNDETRWNQSVTQLKNKSSSRHILVTAAAIIAGTLCLLLLSTPIGVPCCLGLAILGCSYLKLKYKPSSANNRNFMHADYAHPNNSEYILDNEVRQRARNIIDNEIKISVSAKKSRALSTVTDAIILVSTNQRPTPSSLLTNTEITEHSKTKQSLSQQRDELNSKCQADPFYREKFIRAYKLERVIKVVKEDGSQNQPNTALFTNNRQKFFAKPSSIATNLEEKSIPVTARKLCFRG